MPTVSLVLLFAILVVAAGLAVIVGFPWPLAILIGILAPAFIGAIYLRVADRNAPLRRLKANDRRTRRFLRILSERFRAADLKDFADGFDSAMAAYNAGESDSAEGTLARVSSAVAHHPMANPLISAWQRAWKDAASEGQGSGGHFMVDRAGCRLVIDGGQITVQVAGDSVAFPSSSIQSIRVLPWKHILTVAVATPDGTYRWAFAEQTLEVAAALAAAAKVSSKVAGEHIDTRPSSDEEFGPSSALVEDFLGSVANVTSDGWRTILSEWVWVKSNPSHAAARDESMKLAALRASQVGRESFCRRANQAARRAAAAQIVAVADPTGSDADGALSRKGRRADGRQHRCLARRSAVAALSAARHRDQHVLGSGRAVLRWGSRGTLGSRRSASDICSGCGPS